MPHLRGLEAIREIKKLYPGQGRIPDHAPVQGVPSAGPGGRGRWLSSQGGRRLRALAGHPDGQGGKKFISSLLSTEMADLGFAGPSGRPRSPVPREQTIVKLLAEGKTPKEIAELLYISIFTVRRHRDNIMRKLNLKRLADLIKVRPQPGHHYRPPLIFYESGRAGALACPWTAGGGCPTFYSFCWVYLGMTVGLTHRPRQLWGKGRSTPRQSPFVFPR